MTDQTDYPAADFPAMPPAKGGMCPYVTVEGAYKAAEFYKQAFGAEIAFAVPADEQGRTMHLHLYINDSSIMLSDPYPEHGHTFDGHKGFQIQLLVDDADKWADRAIAAGCKVEMQVQEMFWGHRWGSVTDPFGVQWAFDGKPAG